VASVNSLRAKKLLLSPQFIKNALEPEMKRYPVPEVVLWANIQMDGFLVKNLSLFGELKEVHQVLLESMATLLVGGPISRLDDLSARECEAFLRDRNSEPSVLEMSEYDEVMLKSIFKWLRKISIDLCPLDYVFPSEKAPFSKLKLVDKIKELKAFLKSSEILTLYQNLPSPELIDVEELTVYIHAPYVSEREKEIFQKLHFLGVETFKEESLNFIPEDL
jgi:hypothetical protein